MTLSDALVRKLKQEATRTGRPLRAVMEDALVRGLEAAPRRSRYRLRTRRLGGPLPGVDLTKALDVAAALEDAEVLRKLELRK
ncbi:MAG: hypothetical protein AMXMBFR36_36450 [Acidobacteriota bacterium]